MLHKNENQIFKIPANKVSLNKNSLLSNNNFDLKSPS